MEWFLTSYHNHLEQFHNCTRSLKMSDFPSPLSCFFDFVLLLLKAQKSPHIIKSISVKRRVLVLQGIAAFTYVWVCFTPWLARTYFCNPDTWYYSAWFSGFHSITNEKVIKLLYNLNWFVLFHLSIIFLQFMRRTNPTLDSRINSLPLLLLLTITLGSLLCCRGLWGNR